MELPTGKGFADVVYLPKRDINRLALIVELKWDKSAKGAIRQIKEKNMPPGFRDIQAIFFLLGFHIIRKENGINVSLKII